MDIPTYWVNGRRRKRHGRGAPIRIWIPFSLIHIYFVRCVPLMISSSSYYSFSMSDNFELMTSFPLTENHPWNRFAIGRGNTACRSSRCRFNSLIDHFCPRFCIIARVATCIYNYPSLLIYIYIYAVLWLIYEFLIFNFLRFFFLSFSIRQC